jgi:hypothetical protein
VNEFVDRIVEEFRVDVGRLGRELDLRGLLVFNLQILQQLVWGA